jgi:3-hydroxyacyl-CoA dehydrogenase
MLKLLCLQKLKIYVKHLPQNKLHRRLHPRPGRLKLQARSVKQTTQKAKPTPGTAKSKPEGKPVATKTTPKTNADLVVEAVAEYSEIKSPTGDQSAAFVSQLKVLGIANPPAFLANLQKK